MAFRFSEAGIAQIGELAAGYAIGGAVSAAIEPALQSLRNRLWISDPALPVDVGTMAALVRMGRETRDDGAAEARHTGVNDHNFDRYVAASHSPPGAGELLELYRRGRLGLGELETWLERAGLDERTVADYVTLARTHLSPAEAAMARQQSFLTADEQHTVAGYAGVEPADADVQFEISGEPPGALQMIELLRRGKISEARVRQAVVEGRIKLKYVDDVLMLREVPLSPAIAAEAVLRERHLPRDAHYYAEAAGLSTADFDAWVDMMGRPIAVGEALTIINRGFKGAPDGAEAQAYFREVVARSDVRTEYADDLRHLRVHYPPLFQVQRALENGTITKAIAHDTLTKEGYPPEWVDAIVNAHAGGKTAKARDLSAAIIDTLYEAGIDTHPEAEAALEHLGYDPEEASKYLDLWLARRIVGELVAAVSIVRRRYVSWHIDKPEAQKLLGELPLRADYAEKTLPTWDAEREANSPTLTASEIERGFHYARFSFDEAMQRLQLLGYTLDDALTKLWITVHGDPRPAPAA